LRSGLLIYWGKFSIDDSVNGILVVQIGDLIHNLSFIGALNFSFKDVLARRNSEFRREGIIELALFVTCKLPVSAGNFKFELIPEDNFLWLTHFFKRFLQK
jgi:hypothetical protein